VAVGLPPKEENAKDDEEETPAAVDSEDPEVKAIKRIAVNEAARVLADFVADRQPKAAMAR